ncbi:hypothetical protein H9Q70_004309 [Fusarium xylarioides]|nr:hypothetical protein H9Q70_004309 [Fusarium xylarioides]KAG5781918.1 hypothetical protein H9Q73_004415 [Fusarium xylarioides]
MSTNSGSRGLLGLPVEVLMYILDHAELCDLYWLSQTCKTMRCLAKRDFRTIINTNVEDKAYFLLGLAYVLPDHYFCWRCCMLHTVNRHVPSVMSLPCWDYSVNHRRSCAAGYDLQPQHIQLALKYNRLGGFYGDAVANMMRPHQQLCSNGPLGPDIHFSATPEIKNGHFLLHEEWKLHASLPPSLFPSNVYIPICNHIDLLGRRPPVHSTTEILGTVWALVRHAMPLKNREVESYAPRGSCKACSTTYDFSVSNANRVVVNTRHDYGSFNSLDEWKRRSRKTRVDWATSTLDFGFVENDWGEFDEAIFEE